MISWRTIERDEFWGWVLIALGIVAIVYRPFNKINAWLKETGDSYLSIALIVLAVGLLLVAWRGQPIVKAGVLFWMVSP